MQYNYLIKDRNIYNQYRLIESIKVYLYVSINDFFSVKVIFSSIRSMKIDRSYERFILDIALCLKDTEMSFVEGKVAPKYPCKWI